MSNRSLVRCALVACLSLSTGGCGFLLVEGPPSGHEDLEYFTCTDYKLGPLST